MPDRIAVTIESTPKRTFASAADWPGWSRSGRTEALALETLVAAASRYARIVDDAHRRLVATATVADFEVVERTDGSAGTEFGVPSHPSVHDSRPTDAAEAARLAGLVAAAWKEFDRIAAAAPEELRKGPRGGGRNRSKIVGHVTDADRAYANQIGLKVADFGADDRHAVREMREGMLVVLRNARSGAPLAGKRWPARYAARRIAWHALDHAWEIEDRSEPEQS